MDNTLTYKNAGVDVEKASALVNDIAVLRKNTERKHKLFQSFGLFGASFDLSGYRNPVIVTGCDGVGTKIKLLLQYDLLETAGIDLVAMNVNDVLTSNAMPLLFLDYIGVAQIDAERIKRIIAGITQALEGCECILAGGETAEMPDIVSHGMIELSGFCVGAVEKENILDPSAIQKGDVIIGFPSGGFHANGWTLLRRIFEKGSTSFSHHEIRKLLTPTRIYFPEVRALNESEIPVKGMAHITGGGLRENTGRLLGDKGCSLTLPVWKSDMAQKVLSFITLEEAFHTFNMGIGWVIVVDPDVVDQVTPDLPQAMIMGEVDEGDIELRVAW